MGQRPPRMTVSRRRFWRAALAVLLAPGLVLLLLALPRAHFVDPTPTPLIRDRHGRFLAQAGEGADAPLGYWRVDGLPERVVAATVAIEDRRFRRHPGVDPLAVARAVRQNLAAGRTLSGASTLAMQVARLQQPGPRTLPRKLLEATTAVLLTARYGRDAVLRQYLRLVPYGNRVRGISYAARRYLDKPVEDLSWAEIAFLAAIPQAPSDANPYTAAGRSRARGRAARILRALHAGGHLDDAELAQALGELEGIGPPREAHRPAEALHAILSLEAEVLAEPDAVGGVRRATLDLGVQRLAVDRLREGLVAWRERGAGNGAVMVVELPSLAVRAAVGSADYFDNAWAGSIDYTDTLRYPGSTLKPILYARALDRGVITPATLLDDAQRGPAGLANADQRYLGPLLPRRALAASRNVPAVHLLARLGLDAGYDFYREVGLHHDERSAEHWGLGMAIGGFPVTLRALTRAYGALATDGRLRPLRWWEDAPLADGPRVFSEASARQIALFLSDPLARLPTFPRMGFSEFPFPVAIKTGTSSGYRDALAVAFSTEWLVVVWVGHPDFRPMQGLSGYRVGANLAHQILSDLPHTRDTAGLADLGFPPPEGHQSVAVCALSGEVAGSDCAPVFTEWFLPGQAPQDACSVHRRVQIDTRTGAPASAETPPESIREEVFAVLPARYADWAAREGLRAPPGALLAGEEVGEEAVRLTVLSPEDGATLFLDPEAPPGRSSVALRVAAEPAVQAVLWLVDGEPLALEGPPYSARLPLTRGVHRVQATAPQDGGAASQEVEIIVR